jgi:hypothetical protein
MRKMNKSGFWGLAWALLGLLALGAYHAIKWIVSLGAR